jgi:hypothetical protein
LLKYAIKNRRTVCNDREKNRHLSNENKQLKAELRRKEKAIADAAALLVLKESRSDLESPRGRKIALSAR